jgi:hypothetical protein
MAGSFGLPQIASIYDPQVAVDQAALERQMTLAQALRAQSMQSIDPNRQIGGMAYRVSPWEVVAKAVQAMQANRTEKATDDQRAELSQRTMQALAAALRNGSAPAQAAAVSDPNGGRPEGVSADQMAAGGFPQPAPTSAPQQAPASGPPTMDMAALLRAQIINSIGGPGMGAAFAKNYEVPEAVRTLTATGQNPQVVGDLNTQKLKREASAPTRLGNGAYADPSGQIRGLPQAIPARSTFPTRAFRVAGARRRFPVLQERSRRKRARAPWAVRRRLRIPVSIPGGSRCQCNRSRIFCAAPRRHRFRRRSRRRATTRACRS